MNAHDKAVRNGVFAICLLADAPPDGTGNSSVAIGFNVTNPPFVSGDSQCAYPWPQRSSRRRNYVLYLREQHA